MTSSSDLPKGVLVYGASSDGLAAVYRAAARSLGRLAARAGLPLISGGGRGGLMAEAIEGCHEMGGQTIGVLPQFMIEKEWQHPVLSHMIATDSMHSRKQTMASLSLCAIAMPGGIGTFDELMEIMTWRQLGLYSGEVVVLNTAGYFDPLLQMLDKAAQQGFMRPFHKSLFHVASTPEEAIKMALP